MTDCPSSQVQHDWQELPIPAVSGASRGLLTGVCFLVFRYWPTSGRRFHRLRQSHAREFASGGDATFTSSPAFTSFPMYF